MSARLAIGRMLAGPEEWSRRRLQVLLTIAVVVMVAIAGGVVWSIAELIQVGSASGGPAKSIDSADPYGQVPRSASIEGAQPGPLSTALIRTMRIPPPSSLGEVQVGTGFPRSREGALAQLIAIDRRAIESGSVVTAQDVITSWAATGGPTPETWSGVAAIESLVESAGLPANGSTDLAIQLNPTMGLIKDRTPTVCIDFILTATVTNREANRIAVADCQHMVWLGDRWVIASGTEAAGTPSLWPGTQASYEAGYEWLEVEP